SNPGARNPTLIPLRGMQNAEMKNAEWRNRILHSAFFILNLFQVVAQLLAEARVAQLTQRLDLDLADTFACDAELLADFLERTAMAILQAEAQLQPTPLALGELVEHLLDLLTQHLVAGRIRGRQHLRILNKVTELAILLLTHRRLQRDRLERRLANRADLLDRQAQLSRQFLVGWVATQLLEHPA